MKIRNLKFKITFFALFLFLLVAKNADAGVLQKPSPNLGLVGYWSFNEGTSTIALDYSGNKNKGTLVNGPTWVDGKRGKALNFDGGDDYVNYGNLSYTKMPPFSVSTWFRANAIDATDGLINKYNSGSWNGFNLFFGNATTLNAWFLRTASTDYTAIAAEGGVGSVNGYTVKTGVWYHVVITVTSSGMTMFVDGVQRASSGWTGTPGNTTETTNLSLANYPIADVPSRFFNGLIDEVRVYNRALSADEIKKLYESR